MSLKDTAKNTAKGFAQKLRVVEVDLNNRLRRSFGKKINQQVEIHYRGKPFGFMYNDEIETVSIDVIKNDLKDEDMHFDPSKRRMDISDVFVNCSCGAKWDIEIPTTATVDDKKAIKACVKNQPDLAKHEAEGHTLTLKYIETNTAVIPENERLKNFNPERINYYRLFSKKTTEVKYLATYGQDILAEAPQYKYSETTAGGKTLKFQNMMFGLFFVGVFEFLLIYSIVSYFISSMYYSPVTIVTKVTSNPKSITSSGISSGIAFSTFMYTILFIILAFLFITWRLHIRDTAKSTVKYIELQSAPFFISNRGVLPVIMHNSVNEDIWDYQARMMQIDDVRAKDVFYALQSWSDSQIAQLDRANKLGQVEHELTMIGEEMRDIKKLDMEYRTEMAGGKSVLKPVVFGVVITVLLYTLIIYIMGIV